MCNFDTGIGTEELANLEMAAAIVHQLTKNLSMEEIENSGFKAYYVDHTSASGLRQHPASLSAPPSSRAAAIRSLI